MVIVYISPPRGNYSLGSLGRATLGQLDLVSLGELADGRRADAQRLRNDLQVTFLEFGTALATLLGLRRIEDVSDLRGVVVLLQQTNDVTLDRTCIYSRTATLRGGGSHILGTLQKPMPCFYAAGLQCTTNLSTFARLVACLLHGFPCLGFDFSPTR